LFFLYEKMYVWWTLCKTAGIELTLLRTLHEKNCVAARCTYGTKFPAWQTFSCAATNAVMKSIETGNMR